MIQSESRANPAANTTTPQQKIARKQSEVEPDMNIKTGQGGYFQIGSR